MASKASGFLDRIGLECPVVQAGMGGGVAAGALAGAVSAAGALGTVGMMAPGAFARALSEARAKAPRRPVAANLLVPFTRPAHLRACKEADVALVVLHGGIPRRWIERLHALGLEAHVTVGTPQEATRALALGADGVVAQGLEAGGHMVGSKPLAEVLPAIVDAARGAPVTAAGGICDSADVRRVLQAGATAAVAGTRFLLTEESQAHPAYKDRLLAAKETLLTRLFSFGWPMPHRVVPNELTDRWCKQNTMGPPAALAAARLSAPLGRAMPLDALGGMIQMQRPWLPLYTPALPLAGMSAATVDRAALYAGDTVARLDDVLPAADAVARLAPR